MVKFTVLVRDTGSQDPDYSLDFEAPSLPREGDYLSIQRPDKEPPYGEDLVVRCVWWRLAHPETTGVTSEEPKVGGVTEIFVECDQVVGPYSSDAWRDRLTSARAQGVDVEDMPVARWSIREDAHSK